VAEIYARRRLGVLFTCALKDHSLVCRHVCGSNSAYNKNRSSSLSLSSNTRSCDGRIRLLLQQIINTSNSTSVMCCSKARHDTPCRCTTTVAPGFKGKHVQSTSRIQNDRAIFRLAADIPNDLHHVSTINTGTVTIPFTVI
jgi:hypothetical protein